MRIEWLILEPLPLAVFSMSRHQILVKVKRNTQEKINSSEYRFITYFLYILKKPQYPSNSPSFEIHGFQSQFFERQVIALLCLSFINWH